MWESIIVCPRYDSVYRIARLGVVMGVTSRVRWKIWNGTAQRKPRITARDDRKHYSTTIIDTSVLPYRTVEGILKNTSGSPEIVTTCW